MSADARGPLASTRPSPAAPPQAAPPALRLPATDPFAERHMGVSPQDHAAMFSLLGIKSLEQLIDQTVPTGIRLRRDLELPPALTEHEALARLQALAGRNKVARSYLGMGYSDCLVPPVIQRNILENPGWYTQYTPYQSEISQGRLEAMLNFQTLICDLTGMAIANASMLDEGTAAAEAMNLCLAVNANERARVFFVSQRCHPQTIEVVKARAKPKGVKVVVGDHATYDFARPTLGVLVQYPTTDGSVLDYAGFAAKAKAAGAQVVVAADLLALTLLTPPGAWGADVVVGSAQRFGVPMGFGGPHAAFFATSEACKRSMPGRLVGVSKDVHGAVGLRLALGTREQHIRRERATSNICTAQVLLAVMAGMYAVWHGPEGLKRIAGRVRELASRLRAALEALGLSTGKDPIFDTLRVEAGEQRARTVLRAAAAKGMNLRRLSKTAVGVALDETTTPADLEALVAAFAGEHSTGAALAALARGSVPALPASLARQGEILVHPVFRTYHTEHELLRYMRRLESKDLSLTTSMIPLGSCTMKLNATAQMFPVTWATIGRLHPFAPAAQTKGYAAIFADLEAWLAEITGFAAVSLQPNAGSQGEYAGLLVIQAWHASRGDGKRDICLIPASAHGTNPASAVMAGMRVVVVACDAKGNVDIPDLKAKASEHAAALACLMITYPSTHGVFEEQVREICDIVHGAGGQVYMDGANMNAQVGVTRPGDFGPDVCHLNLHKTFCIPHGGGGPGMGPICVAAHLAPFLPGHPLVKTGGAKAIGPIASAPWGSASILVVPWVYIAMMGAQGLKRATELAILNANYMAKRLESHYPVLYRGVHGRVAHEFILDCRPLKETSGVEVEDIAKRLMDYGFHAPTVSFPVAGTLMIEPTESESKAELDRLCDALIAIRKEIAAIDAGTLDRKDNPLKNAPHTAAQVTADAWTHPYSREVAAFPAPWTKAHKFWPSVGRIDNVYGDRNLMCACPPVSAYGA